MIHQQYRSSSTRSILNNLNQLKLRSSCISKNNNISVYKELNRFYHPNQLKEQSQHSQQSGQNIQIYYQTNIKNKIMSSCTTTTTVTVNRLSKDIEDAHQAAVNNECFTYLDPKTGYTVFSELAHLKRGTCCGSACRHCPYGWHHVKNKNGSDAPVAKAVSGNTASVQKLLEDMKQVSLSSTTNRKKVVADSGGRKGGRYTSKNVPYTRTGDSGTSQLLNGEKRSKDDIIFDTMGTIDEMNSTIGVIHSLLVEILPEEEELALNLLDIMSICFDIGSHIAKPNSSSIEGLHVDLLETWIDEMTQVLPELCNFILPTGNTISAHCHVARTVCRRAERCVVTLRKQLSHDDNKPNNQEEDYAFKYLNRLSDYLFTLARYLNKIQGCDEIMYKRVERRVKQRQRVVVNLKPESCIE